MTQGSIMHFDSHFHCLWRSHFHFFNLKRLPCTPCNNSCNKSTNQNISDFKKHKLHTYSLHKSSLTLKINFAMKWYTWNKKNVAMTPCTELKWTEVVTFAFDNVACMQYSLPFSFLPKQTNLLLPFALVLQEAEMDP